MDINFKEDYGLETTTCIWLHSGVVTLPSGQYHNIIWIQIPEFPLGFSTHPTRNSIRRNQTVGCMCRTLRKLSRLGNVQVNYLQALPCFNVVEKLGGAGG